MDTALTVLEICSKYLQVGFVAQTRIEFLAFRLFTLSFNLFFVKICKLEIRKLLLLRSHPALIRFVPI